MPSALTRTAARLARRAVALDPFPQPPLVRTRYPVVLLHGFGAMGGLFHGGLLHGQAMHLRAHGTLAYAPHVNPYDTVEVRARAWAERLDRVLDETGAERLNLIAFSAGGLDARYLAGSLGYADRLAALVTVSTPHRGSALCDHVLGRPERLRGFLLGVMGFFGRAAYEEAEPRVEAALRELAPAFVCGQFEPAHPAPPGVYCASWAGRAGRGTSVPITPTLVLHNRLLFRTDGVNDGMVPEQSARWADFRGTLDADHARQIALPLSVGPFDSNAFFLDLARDLAARGF